MTKPAWQDVRQAILELDANTKTVVRLQSLERPTLYMLVYGPYEGEYGVNVTENDFDFYFLNNLQAEKGDITLFVGGQVGRYKRNHFVPQAIALEAANCFLTTQHRKGDLPWSCQYS